MNKREWRVVIEELDYGHRIGICVGMYRNGEPVCRVAPPLKDIDPDAGATGEQIASLLEEVAEMMLFCERKWL